MIVYKVSLTLQIFSFGRARSDRLYFGRLPKVAGCHEAMRLADRNDTNTKSINGPKLGIYLINNLQKGHNNEICSTLGTNDDRSVLGLDLF